MAVKMAKNSLKKGYIKKDFDKEQMYQKIMPSMPAGETVPKREAVPPLRNYMEDILRSKLPDTLKALNCCACQRCERDVLAIALNSLPVAYVVAGEEQLDKKLRELQGKYDAKATAALIRAVRIVREKPRHDVNY